MIWSIRQGTLCQAADKLKESGADTVHAYITHPVLSGPAIERISKSEIDEIVVTDTHTPECGGARLR